MAQPNLKFKITAVDVTQKAFSAVRRSLARVSKALFSFKTSIAAVAGAAGLGLLVKSSLKSIDILGKTSSKLGIATSELQKLRFASQQAGVETRTVDMAIQRFTRRLAEAAQETGEAKDALIELGIDAKKLNVMSLEQQMLILADAFDDVQNSGDKVRLAFKLFDSEGVAFVNTLQGGSKALQAMFQDAENLGFILSASAVKGVESANDSLLRLASIFKGTSDQLTAAFAPALREIVDLITNKLVDAIKNAGGAEEFGKNLARSIIIATRDASAAMIKFANILIGQINSILKGFDQLERFFGGAITSAEFDKSFNDLIMKFEKLSGMNGSQNFADAMAEIKLSLSRLADPANRTAENIALVSMELENLANRNISAVAVVGTLRSSLEELQSQAGNVREETLQLGTITLSTNDAFNRLLNSVDNMNTELGGSGGLAESTNTAAIGTKILYDEFGDLAGAVGDLSPKLQLTKTSLEQYEDASHQVGKSLDQLAVNSLNKLEDAFAGMVTGTMSAKDAFRSMANSILSDLARIAARKALGSIMGGMGGGGNPLGALLGGFRANGGAVTAGKAYMVGERGAEMFVPNQSGTIVPNNAMGGGGGVTVNQTINLSTGVAQTVRTEVMNMLPQIQNAAVSGVLDAKRRGGSFGTAFGA